VNFAIIAKCMGEVGTACTALIQRRGRWMNLVNISQFKGKFLGNHKKPYYLKQRYVAALDLATKRQLERVILLALSVTLSILLH
jgi:hypothetical protein